MTTAILSLLGGLITLWIFYAKKKAKGKTPNEISEKNIAEMDDALAHGDADRIALEFDELFQDADRYDSGQHETTENGGRKRVDRD